MSLSRLRPIPSVFALAAVALLAAGCGTGPASPAPTSTAGSPSSTPGSDAGSSTFDRTASDIEAAWLDDGRVIGIVTWGSSSCRPHVADVKADGQTVAVTLADPDEMACTDDLGPRAVAAMLPEGVDVTKDIDLRVTYGDVEADADLDGLDAAPQGPGEQQPSAGWFDDDGIVLLTYGSSSCPPVVQELAMTDSGAKVTFNGFETADRVCTMDFAPRATVITLLEDHDDDAPFTLTLVGDNLDAEVPVLG
ncbi:hypothetical protein QF046_001756 [Microbacterium sp. W4I4]|uniref:hypothetical protein n=1 Tax=Microbacterium sp. W4I4 TaxID=3042295 RepID=UPI0027874E70|nr:hypothetical protein [Microbacterium sp. W4I4]MDQ0614115.1 hypothetical protein [Microbacterium sp. W4I4]